MNELFLYLSILIGGLAILTLYRGIYGPTLINRFIGLNVIGTKTVVILLLIGFKNNRIELYIDIALVYAILNFIAALIFAKYLERKSNIYY